MQQGERHVVAPVSTPVPCPKARKHCHNRRTRILYVVWMLVMWFTEEKSTVYKFGRVTKRDKGVMNPEDH